MNNYSSQIAIVGGGICGLWLLNRLRQMGYEALLFEKNELGGEQTLASQGIIHSGIKYDFRAFRSEVSKKLAAMPEIWAKSLAGSGPIDLAGVSS